MTDSRLLLIIRSLLATAFIVFYGVIVMQVLDMDKDFAPSVKDVVVFLLGALTTSVVTIVAFFYNSSQSSAAKDEMLLRSKPSE